MTHTPDHREQFRSAIREWIRDDVKLRTKIALVKEEDHLIEKLLKVVEKAKQDDKKV